MFQFRNVSVLRIVNFTFLVCYCVEHPREKNKHKRCCFVKSRAYKVVNLSDVSATCNLIVSQL
jgi:hypothetical protein